MCVGYNILRHNIGYYHKCNKIILHDILLQKQKHVMEGGRGLPHLGFPTPLQGYSSLQRKKLMYIKILGLTIFDHNYELFGVIYLNQRYSSSHLTHTLLTIVCVAVLKLYLHSTNFPQL